MASLILHSAVLGMEGIASIPDAPKQVPKYKVQHPSARKQQRKDKKEDQTDNRDSQVFLSVVFLPSNNQDRTTTSNTNGRVLQTRIVFCSKEQALDPEWFLEELFCSENIMNHPNLLHSFLLSGWMSQPTLFVRIP